MFDVLQTPAVGQRGVGDVQHVIGFVIGEMNLEQFDVAIDRLDQPAFTRQRMHQPDAAVTNRLRALGDFEWNVACAKHRFVTLFGSLPLRHRIADVAFVRLLFQFFAFVVMLAASGQSDFHLHTPVFEVHGDGDQRQSFVLGLLGELS